MQAATLLAAAWVSSWDSEMTSTLKVKAYARTCSNYQVTLGTSVYLIVHLLYQSALRDEAKCRMASGWLPMASQHSRRRWRLAACSRARPLLRCMPAAPACRLSTTPSSAPGALLVLQRHLYEYQEQLSCGMHCCCQQPPALPHSAHCADAVEPLFLLRTCYASSWPCAGGLRPPAAKTSRSKPRTCAAT